MESHNAVYFCSVMRRKNILYPVVLLLLMFLVWNYRQSTRLQFLQIKGQTMGTIEYTVIYSDRFNRDFRLQVDSLLKVFNQSLNHYFPESEISRFNNDSIFNFELPFFYEVLNESKVIYEQSDGAFDPTIGSLIEMWGFGNADPYADSSLVDSLKEFSGFDKIDFDSNQVWKFDPRTQMDFSAIAKGQGVDLVAEFFIEKGIENFFIEIGGEIRCGGHNPENELWQIGVIDPSSDALNSKTFAILSISDKGIATSANNFNYIIKNGTRYVHTIDPTSGFPIEHNLLSATVIANKCMSADGYATAFMVLGLEKSMAIAEKQTNLQALFIYNDQGGQIKTYISSEIRDNVKLIDDN